MLLAEGGPSLHVEQTRLRHLCKSFVKGDAGLILPSVAALPSPLIL